MNRTAFFLSDRTGLTAEVLGRGLLSQFEAIKFNRVTLRYIDTPEKARDAVERINHVARNDGHRPLVFSTITNIAIRNILGQADALILDLFEMFIAPLESELGLPSSHAVGRAHGLGSGYTSRIDAVNFSLDHDDGGIARDLGRADIILVGVSRCGKTPTALYLALQFGWYAANYPLVEEDFDVDSLPIALHPHQGKLFGLTISAERLHQIREERAPGSRYASQDNCRRELNCALQMMRRHHVPFLDVTHMSVEEIATSIAHRRDSFAPK